MTKQIARFTNTDGTRLTIVGKAGKKAIAVYASLKTPGQPAQTGCRQTFELTKEQDALKAVAALVADAKKNGWEVVEKKNTKNAFATIPMAAKQANGKTAKSAAA